MPLATLEEIRLLSNLETKQDKLLQIVLFGQPELDENLNQEQIRQLRERITHRFNLSPLQTKDVGEYLIFRLRAAGYHGPHLFTDASIKKLSLAAQGLVRRVNILADKALLAAFADNVYQVTPKHVKAAIQDSEFAESLYGQQVGRYKQFAVWFICLLAIVSGIIIAAIAWQQSSAKQSGAKLAAQPAQSTATKSVTVKPSLPQVAKQSAVAVTNTQMSVNNLSALTNTNTPATLKNVAVASDKPLVVISKSAEGLVGQRLDAMSKLLQSAKPETVLLQIKSVPNAVSTGEKIEDAQLVAELESLSRQVEVDNIYLYRMRKADGLYTVVLYGAYAQRADALEALKSLPPYIKNNRPYLRTLAGISKDISPLN